jgi:hypothetical protein
MSKADETAFPVTSDSYGVSNRCGLTKRELFAAMAMQGRISFVGAGEYELCAEYAVAHADALIAALERKPE